MGCVAGAVPVELDDGVLPTQPETSFVPLR
jgi:hypothetical protein